jgi:tRNA (guanine37-N1)-methyltransferase
MVLKPEPIFLAMDDLLKDCQSKPVTIFFSPIGELLNQAMLFQLCKQERFIFICGRYKGVDQRVIDHWVDRQISIGDYVLSGGELPAMVMIEGLTRLIPGVISDLESALTDSHTELLLESPLYTRPEEYRGRRVPDILLSGDHEKIADWRREKALEITLKYRPDLWEKYLKKVQT